jgi:hypothetical protein
MSVLEQKYSLVEIQLGRRLYNSKFALAKNH